MIRAAEPTVLRDDLDEVRAETCDCACKQPQPKAQDKSPASDFDADRLSTYLDVNDPT